MFEVPSIADLNLGLTLPALTLALGACILLLVDALFIPKDKKIRTAWLALIGIGASFTINLFTFNQSGTAFLGMFAADGFTSLMNAIILLTAFLSVLLSVDYVKRIGIERGEFYALILFSARGA